MCIIVTTFEFKTVVPSPYDLTKNFGFALLSGNNPHPVPVESKVFLIKVMDGGSSAALDLIRVVYPTFPFLSSITHLFY